MKVTIRRTIICSILFFSFYSLYSQENEKEFAKSFQQADAIYFYDQNYEKASSLFESLLAQSPDNPNLNAKLGICYLNIDGKNQEALKCLIKASKDIEDNPKNYKETGIKAPPDTYMYLAVAYHRNDSLQKAINLYTEARAKLAGSKTFSEEYFDNQIRDCRYAMEMKKKPLTIISDLFANWLNNYPGACNPVLSKNDSVFIFTQKENGKTRVLCSYKTTEWNEPVDITKQLGGYDMFYTNSITGDGKLLIVAMDDGGDGNLYYSERTGSTWSRIKNIGRPICTIYWQAFGFITEDGKGMYFSSNMPGGEGGLDIWYSQRNDNGKWGTPVNCGNIINTPYNEDTPFFDETTEALYFSSTGHISMGGYDVFRSVRQGNMWTTPIGMPFAFNSTQENTFFILNNNKPGFVTSLYDTRTGIRNIYEIVAEDPASKVTLAKGVISPQDGLALDPKLVHITLYNLKNSVARKTIIPKDSSSYEFEVTPGDYRLVVSYNGYHTDTVNFNIPLYFAGNFIALNSILVPEKVTQGEFLAINNILFGFNSAEIDAQGKSELEKLKSVLNNYPELKVEVAGYTDAIGSKEYNLRLAEKRALKVIEYLSGEGVSRERLVKKAYGKFDFVTVNSNQDGSDNPEGRKYNRRVTFGIVDPKTGVTIRHDTYTPEHLRQKNAIRYNIILLESSDIVSSGYFSPLTNNGLLSLKTFRTDSINQYVLGIFYNKPDAQKYLEFVKEKGFDKAYIITQYELPREALTILDNDKSLDQIDKDLFTVQLKATLKPIEINEVFSGIKGVKVVKAGDGFYKYYYGEFKSLEKAKETLMQMKKHYDDAFIKNLYQLLSE